MSPRKAVVMTISFLQPIFSLVININKQMILRKKERGKSLAFQ